MNIMQALFGQHLSLTQALSYGGEKASVIRLLKTGFVAQIR